MQINAVTADTIEIELKDGQSFVLFDNPTQNKRCLTITAHKNNEYENIHIRINDFYTLLATHIRVAD